MLGFLNLKRIWLYLEWFYVFSLDYLNLLISQFHSAIELNDRFLTLIYKIYFPLNLLYDEEEKCLISSIIFCILFTLIDLRYNF